MPENTHHLSRQDLLEALKKVVKDTGTTSRAKFRAETGLLDSAWTAHFGTYSEFVSAAGLSLSRAQRAFASATGRHASQDIYRNLSADRKDWGDKYSRTNSSRFKTLLVGSDFHDVEVDPFFLEVFIDTARRAQPDVIVLNGDIFDLPEFGKYTVDPREWDVVGRIKFVHENIMKPLREAAPDAQIDLIEANHEVRLLRHLADATPALRAVLADLHGWTLQKLFGLDQFEVNYIAKCDLTAWNKSDINKEISKNYRTYFDCFLAHHYPSAKEMGIPGVNGHHHKHLVSSHYSVVYGSYTWHQLGCGHRLDASYCQGELWNMGFALAHLDTQSKSTNIEYIPVTNHAVVGGKWYHRS
jgi:hypothetical protein